MPRLENVVVEGPHNVTGVTEMATRERVFVCRPASAAEEPACANEILSKLAQRAFRRPVTRTTSKPSLAFYTRRGPRRRLRRRHSRRSGSHAREPLVPVPGREQLARCPGRIQLPDQRRRARIAAVVLPLVEHSRRRAARPGGAGSAARAQSARSASRTAARRFTVASLRREFRRPMAAAAQPRDPGESPTSSSIRISTTTFARHSGARPRCCLRTCCAKGARCKSS